MNFNFEMSVDMSKGLQRLLGNESAANFLTAFPDHRLLG